ncbi:MAG TPA: YkvA family protein [Candidatus Limnocylindrales bacterium]|nr:YkvA family protein [Candidatus Limnocylindrales bacterium]
MSPRKRSRGPTGLIRTLNYMAFAPLVLRLPTYGRLLLALLRDDRVPASEKAVLGMAVAYLALPIDLIPEAIPILGALDDVAVAVLAVDVFLERISPALLDEKLQELDIDRRELDRDLEQVRRVVPRPIRRAAARLPGLASGIADLAARSGLGSRLRAWIKEERPA